MLIKVFFINILVITFFGPCYGRIPIIWGNTGGNRTELCLASSVAEVGIMSYATDIFGVGSIKKEFDVYNCSSSEKPLLFHSCTLPGTICPLDVENLNSFLKVMDWRISPSICRFSNAVRMKENVNIPTVYIFGGSVTIGRKAQGCCCTIDAKCNSQNIAVLCIPYDDTKNDMPTGCGWVDYFSRWLNRSFPSVKIKNLAVGGSTSLAAFLSEQLDIFTAPVKSTDLIILDFSVNDASILKDDIQIIQFGIDGLVRHFLSEGNMPTIILVESWPHPNLNEKTADYYIAYRRVAKHYGLLLWSYKEAVTDPFVREHQSQFADYITWSLNHITPADTEHPHWHAHLFQADLMTAALSLHMNHCNNLATSRDTNNISSSSSSPSSWSKWFRADHQAGSKRDRLRSMPVSIGNSGLGTGCVAEAIKPLHIEAVSQYYRKSHARFIHSNSSSSIGTALNTTTTSLLTTYHPTLPYAIGWKLIEERKGKPGWISIISSNSNSNYPLLPTLTPSHSPTASPSIQKSDEEFNNEKVLQLEPTASIIHFTVNMTDHYSHGDGIVVKIEFLRTYENAGIVDVRMCNQSIGMIDSLWSNYNATKYSVSQIAYFSICNLLCTQAAKVQFEIIHMRIIIPLSSNENSSEEEKERNRIEARVRGNQKFKILSISTCMYEFCHHTKENKLRIL